MRQIPDLTDLKKDEFDLWFGLKSAALNEDWAGMEKLLDESDPSPILNHVLTEAAVQRAVLGGQVECVERMLARGFVPTAMLVETVFTHVEEEGVRAAAAAGVARALKSVMATGAIDPREIVRPLLLSTDPLTLLSLARAAGMDIFNDGESLRRVLAAGDVAGFHALCALGASAYTPLMLRHMRVGGTVEEAPSPQAMRDAWRQILASETADGRAILSRMMPKDSDDYRAAQFLNPVFIDPATGEPVTLLGVVLAMGLRERIFARPANWARHPAEAEMVFRALAEYDAQDGVTLGPLKAHLRQSSIAAQARRRPGNRL